MCNALHLLKTRIICCLYRIYSKINRIFEFLGPIAQDTQILLYNPPTLSRDLILIIKKINVYTYCLLSLSLDAFFVKNRPRLVFFLVTSRVIFVKV